MDENIKKLILRALDYYRGDDYERAKRAFRGLNETELDKKYGDSGQTCREILNGYKSHSDEIDRAVEVVSEAIDLAKEL